MGGVLPRRAETVVVGGGTAGCLVARRLADRGCEVLLLEQGPAAPPGPAVTALDRLPIADPVRAGTWPERAGRLVVRGLGLGGSAAINGGYFLRGVPDDYASWPDQWTPARIEAGFTAVEALLQVSAFTDDELGDAARAFEGYWDGRGAESIRVRSNHRGRQRVTAADVLLAAGRAPVRVIGDARVDEVLLTGDRVTGVRVAGKRVSAGEVVVAAGTLGTAALLRRSGVLRAMDRECLRTREHPERIVRWRPRRELAAPALLQSVVHTGDGMELRCYGDDFARFILRQAQGAGPDRGEGDAAGSGVPVGVADLGHPAVGVLDEHGLDLGTPDAASLDRMDRGVQQVVGMLASSSFAELVEPGSISVDPVLSMSQHATGTLPLGEALSQWGEVPQFAGLRVVDGSVLPGPVRAGPHATIAMVAWVIGGAI